MPLRDNPRRRAAMLLVIASALLTSLISRGRLQDIRTVDAVTLFAIGMTVGAAITNLKVTRRPS